MTQIHKEKLESVPNAKPDRNLLQYEIYGTNGIPKDFLHPALKKQKVDGNESQFPSPPVPVPGLVVPPPPVNPMFPLNSPIGVAIIAPPRPAPIPTQINFPTQPPRPFIPSHPVSPQPFVHPHPHPQVHPHTPLHVHPHPHPRFPSQPIAPLFPVTSINGSTSQPPLLPSQFSSEQLQKAQNEPILIFNDEENSMEELRARLGKYAMNEENIRAKLQVISQSINDRVSKLLA